MTTLLVGGTGATGRLLLQQLLARGEAVRAIVRSAERLPQAVGGHERLDVIEAAVLDLDVDALAAHVNGCDAIASCLGHNLTLRGVFGHPRRLVTEATRRLCDAVRARQPRRPVKFALMNTAGNRNRDVDEPASWAERGVVGLIRMLVPPHADNEQAADYLRRKVGEADGAIEWVVVRPDSLIDEGEVTAYDVHASPIRSAIFNAGKTSRINVAHFMAELICDDAPWQRWRGQMPVIYNRESPAS